MLNTDGLFNTFLKDLQVFASEMNQVVWTMSLQNQLYVIFGGQALGGEGCQRRPIVKQISFWHISSLEADFHTVDGIISLLCYREVIFV